MDTSPEYIEMCKKAHELQETWNPKEGDWFYDSVEIRTIGDSFYLGKWNRIHEIYNRPTWNGKDKPLDATIWLPRIDQLLTLLNAVQNEELHNAGKRFSKKSELDTVGSIFHINAVGDYYDKETSTVEQLFLVGLYNTKYNKYWDGEDWI